MTATTSAAYSAMRRVHAVATSTWNVAFPREELGDWQVRAIEKLASLRNLPQNWNSYGSRPVSDGTLDAAMSLVALTDIPDFAVPSVLPIAGGGVQLGWQHGSREADIEVSKDLTFAVLLTEDDASILDLPAVQIDAATLDWILDWVKQG